MFTMLRNPRADGAGNTEKRWDTARVAKLSEILGFYGLNYWYPWQVTVLGLGPVWQSANTDPRKRAADFYQDFLDFAGREKLFATFLTPRRRRWQHRKALGHRAGGQALGNPRLLRPELLG